MTQERLLKLHRHAGEEFDRRLQSVGDDQWHLATPCTAWDVWSLLNHVVAENRWVPYTMDGATIAEVGNAFDGDVLDDDPRGAWSSSMTAAFAAFEAPSAASRTVHLSRGDSPAATLLEERVLDLAIHAWDLARSTGADEALDATLVDELWRTWWPRRRMLRDSGFFGAPVPVKAGRDRQTRLLALVGRVA